MFTRPNALGDLRAEADGRLLDQTFVATADYLTLIETTDRVAVVGRRGTGKSALTRQLTKHWKAENRRVVVLVSPEEYETIGARPIVELFGDTFNKVRAGSKLGWKYALIVEAASLLESDPLIRQAKDFRELKSHIDKWVKSGIRVTERLSATLTAAIEKDRAPEQRIGDMPRILDLAHVENLLISVCDETNFDVSILVDRLDEGYEPDDVGVAFIDGLLQAAIDLKTRSPRLRPVVFLRDNIFRAVHEKDPDYSRNIEGQTLRLHWSEEQLFQFTANRLKAVLNIQQEASNKVWNKAVAGDLKDISGFRKCLQLTLYRPRDLLSLLNDAFYLAGKDGQGEITLQHIEKAGRQISKNRLQDLVKEYSAILPSIGACISAFKGGAPKQTTQEALNLLDAAMSRGSEDARVQQDFFIINDAIDLLRGLYSVGFVGLEDHSTGNFVFCHDGRSPDADIESGANILIHPCYWMSLGVTEKAITEIDSEEIYDEYDISVSSETPAIRNKKIEGLIKEIDQIELGKGGDAAFEGWVAQAVKICFAKSLRNVELKPNKLAQMRRDVVSTNLAESGAWKRIRDDYGSRQVIFEAKNYTEPNASDFYQMNAYLVHDYGSLGFLVCRGGSTDLYKGRDVDWVRTIYSEHKKIVIKLTDQWFCRQLRKLIRPQKHDAVDDSIHQLLDTYTRMYLAGQGKRNPVSKRRRKKAGSKESAATAQQI